MSQTDWVLSQLKRRPLTAADGFNAGIYRLAARVKDLRDRGYPVKTALVRKGNKRFARYWLSAT